MISIELLRRPFCRISFLLAFSSCFLLFGQKGNTQNRPLQTIRRVTVTNQYVLENGKNTGKNWAVYQEIYDSLGRLHTEIEYDFVDHYPHHYKWHTFDGKQITRTDFFENEKLQMIKEFGYNKDSLISQEVIKIVKPGDTAIYVILTYKYNQLKKPIQIEAKTASGKTAYKTKSTYDSHGTELSRIVNTKAGYFPLDSIIDLTCNPQYDSLGRVSSKLISTTKVKKVTTEQTYKYTYDKKNNIVGITILDSQGKQTSREERIFQEGRNRLIQLKFYDAGDSISKWFGLRYEIYRNKNRRIYEIDY